MHAYSVLALVLALFFGALGTAKVRAVPAMRARAAHSGLSVDTYRGIGVLELAGSAGLLVGLGVAVLGRLAAVGLLLLLAGALATHLRNHDAPRHMAAAIVAAVLVAAYLVLRMAAS